MSYEQWDNIADAYIPLLLVLYIAYSIYYFKRGDRLYLTKGIIGVLLCYSLMVLDKLTHACPMLGLDYSTHSSLAFVLVFVNRHKHSWGEPLMCALLLSLLGYYLLELYQQYHTVLDIVTTVIVVGPLLLFAYRLVDRHFGYYCHKKSVE